MASILQINSDNVDWDEAFANLKKKINELENSKRTSLETLRMQIKYCRLGLSEIRAFVTERGFDNEEFEIRFFKSVKPRFFSLLIYYCKVFEIEVKRPVGNKGALHDYFVKELNSISQYFERNAIIYQYYRSGDNFLDKQFFVRNNEGFNGLIDFFVFNSDTGFSTSTDYSFAKMMAYEMLSDFLSNSLDSLNDDHVSKGSIKRNVLPWSASTVALGELIYALHAASVFEGQKDVRSIASFFSEIFNVKISNIYKIFEEIRLRKKNRTSFMDVLKAQLVRKMDEDDERG